MNRDDTVTAPLRESLQHGSDRAAILSKSCCKIAHCEPGAVPRRGAGIAEFKHRNVKSSATFHGFAHGSNKVHIFENTIFRSRDSWRTLNMREGRKELPASGVCW